MSYDPERPNVSTWMTNDEADECYINLLQLGVQGQIIRYLRDEHSIRFYWRGEFMEFRTRAIFTGWFDATVRALLQGHR